MRKKLSYVLVATLLSVLLLVGLAYAAQQSRLLERLFPASTPSPQAQQLVTPLNLTETVNGVSFTINEYLWDGSDLYVNWTASTEGSEPVILLPAPMTATGAFLTDNGDPRSYSLEEGTLLGDPLLGVELKRSVTTTNIGEVRGTFPSVPFEVTMSALFLSPTAEVVKVEDLTDRARTPTVVLEDWGDRNTVQLISNQRKYVEEDGTEVTERSEDILDEYFQAHPPSWRSTSPTIADYQAAYEALGYAKAIAVIEHTFIVEPDPQHIIRTQIDGPASFRFDEFDIQFTRIDFTAASTHINYTLTSKLPETAREGDKPDWVLREIWFDVYVDGETDALQLESDRGGGATEATWKGALWGDPLTDIPQSVTIIPRRKPHQGTVWYDVTNETETQGNMTIYEQGIGSTDPDTPMEDHKMVIPLKQVSG